MAPSPFSLSLPFSLSREGRRGKKRESRSYLINCTPTQIVTHPVCIYVSMYSIIIPIRGLGTCPWYFWSVSFCSILRCFTLLCFAPHTHSAVLALSFTSPPSLPPLLRFLPPPLPPRPLLSISNPIPTLTPTPDPPAPNPEIPLPRPISFLPRPPLQGAIPRSWRPRPASLADGCRVPQRRHRRAAARYG